MISGMLNADTMMLISRLLNKYKLFIDQIFKLTTFSTITIMLIRGDILLFQVHTQL